jgi:hypothetical protein
MGIGQEIFFDQIHLDSQELSQQKGGPAYGI